MQIDYALLRTMHRILRQITDLNERLEKGPRQIRVAEAAESNFADALQTTKDARTKTKMAADEKQLQLSEREARIEDLKAKRNSADSNKEYQLLNEQIAADEQANLVLSDEILELLEKIDVLDGQVQTDEENLSKAAAETANVKKRVTGELESLNSELARVKQELTENEKRLPGEIKTEYQRIVSVRGEDTFAEADLQNCGQCFTKMTPQMASELLLKKPVFCKSCGSILYLKDSVKVES